MIQSTIRSKNVLNCLPLLASILGRNYGVKVEIGGGSAYTDGSTIHLPSLPLDCDTDLLHLARGYLDHESAHIRHTNFQALQNAGLDTVTKHLWNSIEDWRVEDRLSQIYPGCRSHFQWLIRKVFLHDANRGQGEAGSPSANPASSILQYVLLTVRSWAVPELSARCSGIAQSLDRNFQGLRNQVDAVLASIQRSCQSTQDAIDYACTIADILKKWQPEQTASSEQSAQTEGETEDSLKPGESSASGGQSGSGEVPPNAKSTTEAGSDEIGKSSPLAQGKRENKKSIYRQQQDSIRDLFACDASELPKSLGELLADRLEGGRASRRESAMTVAKVGKVSACTIRPEEKEESLRASIALRSRLHGLLEAKTRQSVGIGRRGQLATKNLYRLSVGNPRIFKNCEETKGLSTAVHLLLDVSSSMSGTSIQLARKSCYAVLKALSGIKGINGAVTAFPANDTEDSVAPLARHGQAIPSYLSVKASGSTPLSQALWWVMQEMFPLKEARKIVVVLSDGMPDSVEAAQYAITQAKRIGFEIYGIGIISSAISQILPETNKTIWNLNELTQALFSLLQKALVQAIR